MFHNVHGFFTAILEVVDQQLCKVLHLQKILASLLVASHSTYFANSYGHVVFGLYVTLSLVAGSRN